MTIDRPSYEHYPEWWRQHGPERIAEYTSGERSFISGLLPEEAVKMSGVELMQILYQRLGGETLQTILTSKPVRPDVQSDGVATPRSLRRSAKLMLHLTSSER